MNSREIYIEKLKLKKEELLTKDKLNQIHDRYKELTEICPHEIVFKYRDNVPRKLAIDGRYLCPCCGKIITCCIDLDIKKSVFKNSHVISLTNLSLISDRVTLTKIRKEVANNIDFYYNLDIDSVEKTNKMENVLRDYQCSYKRVIKNGFDIIMGHYKDIDQE